MDTELRMTTPHKLGYRLPAEWEPHAATWLTWPDPRASTVPEHYESVRVVYGHLIRQLVGGEEVHVATFDAELEAVARESLQQQSVPLDRVRFHRQPLREPWCRDFGPMFLVRNQSGKHERAVVDWGFNGWGDRYTPNELEDQFPQYVAQYRQVPVFTPGMILEGGSIEANGRGTLLATESCLLNPNRNPLLSQLQVQLRLKEHLGAANILWFAEGITGDDTDGRVDQIARFLNPSTIAVACEENIDDANYPALQENLQRLRTMRDQNNRLFRVVKVPMPRMVEHLGRRLPASYLNFYIANAAVLVPTFRRPQDNAVLELFRKEFSDRPVVGLDCAELVWSNGSLHALALQEPA
jgi:agmatine deiminase